MADSWIEHLENGWKLLSEDNPDLDVERFYRHTVTAFRSRAVDGQHVAVIATRMLDSPLKGAPYLGRKLLEQAGLGFAPVGFAHALALLTGRGGPTDIALAHETLENLARADDTSRDLKGLSFSTLADSYRSGRGVEVDVTMAKQLYQKAAEHGYTGAARNLGLYFENRWGSVTDGEPLPNLTEAARYYRMGASKDSFCAQRLEAVRAELGTNRKN